MKEYTLIYPNSLDRNKLMVAHLKIGNGETLTEGLARINKKPSEVLIIEGKHYRMFVE